jgi:prepilin-type N-terminal cleavage/methylation domain-containing protein
MEGMMQDRSKRGFTLIELKVAIAAFGVMSLAGFAVLSTGQRTSVSNDQTVQIQQNVRLAMDLIARDVRMASFGNAPAGSFAARAIPPAGCTSPINTGDNAAGEDGGPDSISVMTVFQQLGTLTAAFTAGNSIAVSAPGPVLNDVISLEGTFTATVNGVAPPNVTLSQAVVAPTNYGIGTAVVQIRCIRYTVSNAAANPPYQLLRDNGTGPIAVVDGIETLQIAYALDTNNDGIIDDQPGIGTAGVPDCKDFVPNDSWFNKTCGIPLVAGGQSLLVGSANYASANTTPTAIRQVRLTVVGRAVPPAAMNFPGNCWRDTTITFSAVVQAEDQLLTEPNICGNVGGIRRRVLSRMVTLRNGSNL